MSSQLFFSPFLLDSSRWLFLISHELHEFYSHIKKVCTVYHLESKLQSLQHFFLLLMNVYHNGANETVFTITAPSIYCTTRTLLWLCRGKSWRTQETMFNYPKSPGEKREYGDWNNRVNKAKRAIYQGEKKRVDTDLELSSWFSVVFLTWCLLDRNYYKTLFGAQPQNWSS